MKFVVCVIKVPLKRASSASSVGKVPSHMLLEKVFVSGGNRLSKAPAEDRYRIRGHQTISD
jgi:hypothetical protein